MAQALEISPRDYAMARLAAARVAAQSAMDAIDDALAYFVDPDEDERARERKELIETALESAGMCSRALECAQEAMPVVDPEECEPWDGDEDEEDEDDDSSPAILVLPKATARKRRS